MLKEPVAQRQSERRPSDRRIFERRPATGQARGHRVDHTISARQNPRVNLALWDMSAGGLSAVADHPVQQGESLCVYIPGRGTMPAWDAVGRVLRCEPGPMGYRIAVEFEQLPAA